MSRPTRARCFRQPRLHLAPGVVLAGILLLLPGPPAAAQAEEEEVKVLEVEPEKERLECPKEQPALLITAPQPGQMTLKLTGQEDGSTRSFSGKLEPGRPFRQGFPQDKPAMTYQAELRIDYADGKKYEGVMGFTFLCVPRIDVKLAHGGLDLARGLLRLQVEGPAVRAEATVLAESSNILLQQTFPLAPGGGRKPLEIRWPMDERGFGGLELKLFDRHATWVQLKLTPFALEIPHEDVVFENGKWAIRPSEEPKLQDTLQAIRAELERFVDDLTEPSLYIVGYTDTVGSRGDNQTLSTNRARSIGRWFREHGLKNPVFFQGFGEDILAVDTADETPEPANRRATYILTNFPPPVQPAMPRTAWQRLP